jgi:DNA-binding beta-propeller fold protein YncE
MRLAHITLLVPLWSALAIAQSAPTTRLVVGEGLQEPYAVDFDAAGRMFIAQSAGNRVAIWTKGVLTTVSAPFSGPHHLLRGPDGHIYVADTWNNVVRRIDARTGSVAVFAGTGEKGFSGDGGPGRDARFGSVFAIAFHGGQLFVADLDNRRIRAIDLATGVVRTVAGTGEKGVPTDGSDARLQPLVDPRAVAVDSTGRIYICERGGHAVRLVETDGRIRTVAGTGMAGFSGDGGPALEARLNGPKHISIDRDDTVLVSDTENHVIRRYVPRTGRLERVAGTGEKGAAGLGGPPTALQLNRPHGAYRYGNVIYISDSDNHRVIAIE